LESTPIYSEFLAKFERHYRPRVSPLPAHFPDIKNLSLVQRKRELLGLIYVNGDAMVHQILHLLKTPIDHSLIDVDMVLDPDGRPPLHWAAACSQLRLVAVLIDKGCDVRRTDNEGNTALMHVITCPGNYQTQTMPELLILLRHTVFLTDINGQSLLHRIAIASSGPGHWKYTRYYGQCIVEFLRREMARGVPLGDYVDAQDVTGNTALHYACRQRNFKLVDWLLNILKARMDIPNMTGSTAEKYSSKDHRMSRMFEQRASGKVTY
jgi:hypothetical protein